MNGNVFLERLRNFGAKPALATPWGAVTYDELLARIDHWQHLIREQNLVRGSCVALRAEYSPDLVALFLALFSERHVLVPMAAANLPEAEQMYEAACVAGVLDVRPGGECYLERRAGGNHELLQRLRARGEAGLILFSSGSAGEPKAALLSMTKLLSRYDAKREGLRTLSFLSLDHIGGVNTLLFTLCNGGLVIAPGGRTPDAICAMVAQLRVELLPTTPTFLNLLLMSRAHERHDLSSLRLITYGTECMPQATLTAVAKALPQVRLKQTYGSTELGILPTSSESSRSLWLRMGGEGYEVRNVGGVAHIRSKTQMDGYLNASQPFDAEGWFNTGDLVEERDGYLRIAGRQSEIINVAGEKVFPIEVENVLLEMANVKDAVVRGRRNAVMGQVVTALVSLFEPEELDGFEVRMRAFCKGRLAEFKIPVLIEVTQEALHGERFKRTRSA